MNKITVILKTTYRMIEFATEDNATVDNIKKILMDRWNTDEIKLINRIDDNSLIQNNDIFLINPHNEDN